MTEYWPVAFLIAVARDVDARSGSSYEERIMDMVALRSPTTAMDWAISALRDQVRSLMARPRAPLSP